MGTRSNRGGGAFLLQWLLNFPHDTKYVIPWEVSNDGVLRLFQISIPTVSVAIAVGRITIHTVTDSLLGASPRGMYSRGHAAN